MGYSCCLCAILTRWGIYTSILALGVLHYSRSLRSYKPGDSGSTLATTRSDTWFVFLRMEIQFKLPRDEVSTRIFYYHDFRSNVVSQTQSHGRLSHSTIQNTADDQRRTMSGGKARPVYAHCGIVFKRIQEYNRHIRDKHTDRRRCPFCDFEWSRPDKIKVHLISKHAKKFAIAEILEAFKGLRGRHVIEFVDAYDY